MSLTMNKYCGFLSPFSLSGHIVPVWRMISYEVLGKYTCLPFFLQLKAVCRVACGHMIALWCFWQFLPGLLPRLPPGHQLLLQSHRCHFRRRYLTRLVSWRRKMGKQIWNILHCMHKIVLRSERNEEERDKRCVKSLSNQHFVVAAMIYVGVIVL